MTDDKQKVSRPTSQDLAELKLRSEEVEKLLQTRYKSASLTSGDGQNRPMKIVSKPANEEG